MQVLRRLSRLWISLPFLALNISACSEPLPERCIPIDSSNARGLVKISIRSPGHYCLTENLHARIEMADHWAEKTLILINTNDVIIDLMGHTLGRGRLFVNPGGHGIEIFDEHDIQRNTQVRNITITNGVIENFEIGIMRWGGFYPKKGSENDSAKYDLSLQSWQDRTYNPLTNKWSDVIVENEQPIFNEKTNTYHFPRNNIRLENITFKNNKENFRIHARTDVPPPDNP